MEETTGNFGFLKVRTAASSGLYRQWVERALKALGPSSPSVVYRWIRDNVT